MTLLPKRKVQVFCAHRSSTTAVFETKTRCQCVLLRCHRHCDAAARGCATADLIQGLKEMVWKGYAILAVIAAYTTVSEIRFWMLNSPSNCQKQCRSIVRHAPSMHVLDAQLLKPCEIWLKVSKSSQSLCNRGILCFKMCPMCYACICRVCVSL